MKSFADWTDEIRALMNPPAPVVDTCNWGDVKWVVPTKFLTQEEFHKQYQGEWTVQRMREHMSGNQWDKAYMDMVLTRYVQIIYDEEAEIDPIAWDKL